MSDLSAEIAEFLMTSRHCLSWQEQQLVVEARWSDIPAEAVMRGLSIASELMKAEIAEGEAEIAEMAKRGGAQ